EELHFNRYRRMTLEAGWSSALPWTRDYRTFCDEHEALCLAAAKWGKRWANPSCEAMFGPADPPGVFVAGGAPRWKQRALYDAMKDACALADDGFRLARVSVHDHVNGVRVGDALEGAATIDAHALAAFVRQRAM